MHLQDIKKFYTKLSQIIFSLVLRLSNIKSVLIHIFNSRDLFTEINFPETHIGCIYYNSITHTYSNCKEYLEELRDCEEFYGDIINDHFIENIHTLRISGFKRLPKYMGTMNDKYNRTLDLLLTKDGRYIGFNNAWFWSPDKNRNAKILDIYQLIDQ